MRGRLVARLLAAIAAIILILPHADAAELNGIYASPGIGILVEFNPCADEPATICGRLLWAWQPASTSHAQIGDIILTGLRWDGDSWVDGRLVSPENGSVYEGEITPGAGGTIHLKGCIVLFLCESQVWRSWRSLVAELPSF